jgi:hypothetical protein
MKTLMIAAALLASATPAMAQTSVNITIGQPGYYGRIDIGNFAPPPLVYAQPVIIERQVRYVREPVYLRVPPGHMRNWGKHCGRYHACGQQVYFVRDEWYSQTYAPRYREQHGHSRHHDEGRGQGKHKDKHKDKHHGHD